MNKYLKRALIGLGVPAKLAHQASVYVQKTEIGLEEAKDTLLGLRKHITILYILLVAMAALLGASFYFLLSGV